MNECEDVVDVWMSTETSTKKNVVSQGGPRFQPPGERHADRKPPWGPDPLRVESSDCLSIARGRVDNVFLSVLLSHTWAV